MFSELALSENPAKGEDLIAELQDAVTPSHLVTLDICKKLRIYGKAELFLEKFDVEDPMKEGNGLLVAKRLISGILASDEFIQDPKKDF